MNVIQLVQQYPEIIFSALFLLNVIFYLWVRVPIYGLNGPHIYDADPDYEPTERVPVSVVVICPESGKVLEENIDAIARQDYPDFEVIIVDDEKNEEMTDIVTRLENKYPYVRHTFIPASARYVSHTKLAITLGVRAACHEWVLLTSADCFPTDVNWVKTLSAPCGENYDFVLGYSNFDRSGGFVQERHSLDRLIRQLRFFRAAGAHRNSKAIGTQGQNLMFRKSLFIENKGFSNNLNLLGGEDLLFVDAYAKPGRSAVVCGEVSAVRQMPSLYEGQWDTEKLVHAIATGQLSRSAKWERLKWGFSTLCLFLAILSFVALLGWFLLNGQLIPAGITVFVGLAFFVLDEILFNQVARSFGESRYIVLYPLYNLTQPLFNIGYRIQSHKFRRMLVRGI